MNDTKEFVMNEDGRFMPLPTVSTEVYFDNYEDADEFDDWIAREGGELFTAYQETLHRPHSELCMSCRWRDLSKAQCYDGHIQRVDLRKCEGWKR